MLDVIEDWLHASGITSEKARHRRIDGATGAAARQRYIEEYSKPDSNVFLMLISTRAGGLGLNLATADTIVLFDPAGATLGKCSWVFSFSFLFSSKKVWPKVFEMWREAQRRRARERESRADPRRILTKFRKFLSKFRQFRSFEVWGRGCTDDARWKPRGRQCEFLETSKKLRRKFRNFEKVSFETVKLL